MHDTAHAAQFLAAAVPRSRLVRIHCSSGTTGKPTVVGYTAADIEHWSNLVARSIRAAGGRSGDILHNAYGYGVFTGGLGPTTVPNGWAVPWCRSRGA